MFGGWEEEGDVRRRLSLPRKPNLQLLDHCLDLLLCRPWSGGYSVIEELVSALDCFAVGRGMRRSDVL